jgi:ATP-dependent helicase/nuclease subunit B
MSFDIHFLLVPDRGAARRLRRRLAENGLTVGIKVGTTIELLERVRQIYLAPNQEYDWNHEFSTALQQTSGFWSKSLSVAADVTAPAVESAWRQVFTANAPTNSEITITNSEQFPVRTKSHLEDLLSLTTNLVDHLPPDLHIIRHALDSDSKDVLKGIRLYHLQDWPVLNQWQMALINKLNKDCQTQADPVLSQIMERGLPSISSNTKTALHNLQSNLFGSHTIKTVPDNTVQWFGVRDSLEEAEVTAGIIQKRMQQDQNLQFSDFAITIPNDPDYFKYIKNVFKLGGIPTSGLPIQSMVRDIGRETILYFLTCQQKPAPAMALSALLSSPLMPWDRIIGARLSQRVMDGDYSLELAPNAPKKAHTAIDLIRTIHDTPKKLIAALLKFKTVLNKDEGEIHYSNAMSTIWEVTEELKQSKEIDWSHLKQLSNPNMLTIENNTIYTRNGVTVLMDDLEPWRDCLHLLVLGFSSQRYPTQYETSPVFSNEDVELIRSSLNLPLQTPQDIIQQRRNLFRRQLATAQSTCTFLVPRRDSLGKSLTPSDSLVFMHQLVNGPDEAEDLILDLDLAEDRARADMVQLAEGSTPTPPRTYFQDDIQFKQDLMTIGAKEEGELRPQSPSSLEQLMISPLSWLLQRLGVEPSSWAPESPDVALRGSLAHMVFEDMFQPNQPLPPLPKIKELASKAFDEKIIERAPFLNSSQWMVERKNLEREIVEAATEWRGILGELKVKIVASEIWLEGKFDKIPIHGQADTVLKLPDGKLLVVDYKKAGSSSRQQRMEKGFDSQVSLYKTMIETGGPKEKDQEAVGKVFEGAKTDVLYFMMNDKAVLADANSDESKKIPGWKAVTNNVSENALHMIRERVKEIRTGTIQMNSAGDEEYFTKEAKVTPYALESSPLVKLFTKPYDLEEGDES